MCLPQLSCGRRDSWEGAEEHSGHAGALRTCRSTQGTQEYSGDTCGCSLDHRKLIFRAASKPSHSAILWKSISATHSSDSVGRALQPLPALGQTALEALPVYPADIRGAGDGSPWSPSLHIYEFIPAPSFAGSAGFGGAAPPSHHLCSLHAPAWRMLFAAYSPHLSRGHSSLSPSHHQQHLKNS